MRRAGLLLLLAALGGCGGNGGDGPALTVSAASSLGPAFTGYARNFRAAEPRFSFAGSDELAAQLRRGARPDVYAAANTSLPAALHAEGLVETPVAFARNRLVVAVPTGSPVEQVADLARPGVTVAIGSESVPVGAYTRALLGRLPAAVGAAIRANVRTAEPDAASIVGKLTRGAVDAGFVYATDVRAAGGELRAVELPSSLRPEVAYAAAVVRGTRHPSEARAFVRGLRGAPALRHAGFLPP